jgi:Protein of unknown function (DUF1553)/Protein of unknown function (DUF1549)/Planctomycete cytochrome C
MSDRRRGVWQLCRLLQVFLALHLLNAALPAVAGDQPVRPNRTEDAETIFELEIRPVLAGTCFKCHGDKKASHGLRTDSRESLLRGGESGPAITPGKPEKSLLIQAIRYSHADIRMPPDKRLPDRVVAEFERWIRLGAPWPSSLANKAFRSESHWAFEAVRKVSAPADDSGWAENPIDRFIAAKWREQGVRPARPAEPAALLRRVYFDLVGLPPSPEEMSAFLCDSSPDAWARVVERLLASPRYGERWGRHWLDVARYADTAGDNADYPIPEARFYRDYVIDSFNADKPYDRFVQEQLAGDLLAKQAPRDKYAESVIATGFLALSRRYATGPYELWPLTLEDTIETTGRAFLGLTLRCARCHDHKYDPITQKDYYALYGIFASTQFPWAGAEELQSKQMNREYFVPLLPPDEAAPLLRAHERERRRLEGEIERATKDKNQKEVARLRGCLRKLLKPGLAVDLPGAYAVQEGTPVDSYVHLRGDEQQRGPTVTRDVPEFLRRHPNASPLSPPGREDGGEGRVSSTSPLTPALSPKGRGSGFATDPPEGRRSSGLDIPPGASGRLQLAEWLTRADNPLTARVIVNRIWQHHFGKGIVTTPSNFGVRGEAPTHPELLDWLTERFIESGWSIKSMHRLILSSKTYRLASDFDEDNAARDPSNRWYWRFDRQRLDAEPIRDALLAVSGNLDLGRPPPHPFPPIDHWAWTQHQPFKECYPSNHRSVYLMTQRLQRHPFLALFDGADTNTSTEARRQSTVPLQALFFMNNPFLQRQAQDFARRLIASPGDVRRRIELAHALAWSRTASVSEQDAGAQYLRNYMKDLSRSGTPNKEVELEAWTSYARVLLSANEFVYVD